MSLSLCIYLLFWVVCVCVQMGGAHLDIYTQEIMLMWQASFDQRWPKTSAKLSRWRQVQFTRGILRLNKKFTYRSCCSCYHSLDWDTPNVSRFDPKPSAMSTVSSRMSKKSCQNVQLLSEVDGSLQTCWCNRNILPHCVWVFHDEGIPS